MDTLANGYYTVTDEKGIPRTFRLLTRGQDAKRLKGKQVVSYLSNVERGTYTQFATIRNGHLAPWAVWKDTGIMQAAARLVEGDESVAVDAALAYAQQTGRCFVCGKLLTDPASVNRGYGPVCLPYAEWVLARYEQLLKGIWI